MVHAGISGIGVASYLSGREGLRPPRATGGQETLTTRKKR